MNKKRFATVAGGVVAVFALVIAVLVLWPGNDRTGDGGPTPDPITAIRSAAEAFATAWQGGSLAGAPVTAESGDVAGITALITAGLGQGTGVPAPMVAVKSVAGPMNAGVSVEPDGSEGDPDAPQQEATATATVTWALGADRTWTYDTTFDLSRVAGTWLVDWKPAVVEPSLGDGEVLRIDRVSASRGRILDTTGAVLRGEQGSVTVGIKPSRSPDPKATAIQVAGLVAVDPVDLVARVEAANPDDFVEVATLARADYDAVRADIQPLPGTVFREEAVEGAISLDYAPAVLGSTGTATDEIVAGSDGRIAAGETTGLSGIEASKDDALSGKPGLSIWAASGPDGATVRVVQDFPGAPGADVTVTLDQRIQNAAALAVANTATPSALVAIRVSTGDVVAVANGPSGSSGFNRAMIGKYPPGSTFKVATTFGLLQKGLTPDTVIDCPASIVVGKKFVNAGGEVLGPVPFRTDFADSCNTAFIGQAGDITPDELTLNAASLGYRDLDLGTPVFGGSVPVTADPTEHAANMIGQGKVEGSPLAVALASASVASGTSLQPRLIIDPTNPAPTPGAPLPAAQIEQLRSLMRSVVVDGTGSALARVPGGEVSGKTGTAEFGTESPPRTHAWFTGFQGDLAFAVLVEDGGFGGAVAAPLAAQFLTTLAG